MTTEAKPTTPVGEEISGKRCVVCGKSFNPRVHNQKVCGTECRTELTRQTHRKRERIRWRSDPVYRARKENERAARDQLNRLEKSVAKTCSHCGEVFVTTQFRQLYCEPKCQKAAAAKTSHQRAIERYKTDADYRQHMRGYKSQWVQHKLDTDPSYLYRVSKRHKYKQTSRKLLTSLAISVGTIKEIVNDQAHHATCPDRV